MFDAERPFLSETTVHVDDNELVVRAILFDTDAQVIAMGTSTDRKIIKWIKQQEIKQQQRYTRIKVEHQFSQIAKIKQLALEDTYLSPMVLHRRQRWKNPKKKCLFDGQ